MASQGNKLLKGRYTLSRLVSQRSQSEVWLAHDQDSGPVLLKLWGYQGDRPNDVQRREPKSFVSAQEKNRRQDFECQ